MSLNLSLKYSLEDGLQLSFSIVSVSIQRSSLEMFSLKVDLVRIIYSIDLRPT